MHIYNIIYNIIIILYNILVLVSSHPNKYTVDGLFIVQTVCCIFVDGMLPIML